MNRFQIRDKVDTVFGVGIFTGMYRSYGNVGNITLDTPFHDGRKNVSIDMKTVVPIKKRSQFSK
ncbi:hypothetical protein [Pedobacter cryophilus]|uniref:Uncharacterized protein n=1 Tax=Pedobacter cryophilus TaxID=2571271 RepID=A0A4U1BWI7_9SPHI|nr:hypothetical protein [Pedobacter cryophilus]TKB96862.1 hypothetical protein FA046_12350 [Pedobacter cryophilus]